MPDSNREVAAVVVAAGSGSRFADSGPRKQYRELRGSPLLLWALRTFLDHPRIGRTIVVLPPEDLAAPPGWLRDLPLTIVAGGAQRGDSVRNGLLALPSRPHDLVLIHDGARPFATAALIDRVLEECDGVGGIVPALPITDTVKEVDADGLVVGTLDRSRYWRVQTPQAFPLDALRLAHDRALAEGVSATDDAALFERNSLPVRIVPGEETNIKVTGPLDFQLADVLAQRLPLPL